MDADERYDEAERIAVRMGFHQAFLRAAQGQAAERARARRRTGLAGRGARAASTGSGTMVGCRRHPTGRASAAG